MGGVGWGNTAEGGGGDTVVCIFNIGINVLVVGLDRSVARAGGRGSHSCLLAGLGMILLQVQCQLNCYYIIKICEICTHVTYM